MSFDQSAIVAARVARVDAEIVASWDSTAAPGTMYQVYVDGALVWHGTATRCVVPHAAEPAGHFGDNALRRLRVDVGTVGPGEAATDFSGSLPSPPGGGSRARLEWQGGSFLGDVVSFNLYAGRSPGGAVDYSDPVATIAAYPQGQVHDGFGLGPYGAGLYGMAAGLYSWTSPPLANGTWNFAVAPVDSAGLEGSPQTASQAIAGPPQPVPRDASGRRVTYTLAAVDAGGFGVGPFGLGAYGTLLGFGLGPFGAGVFGTGEAGTVAQPTLSWQPSPG